MALVASRKILWTCLAMPVLGLVLSLWPQPAWAAQLLYVRSATCEWCEMWEAEVGAEYAKTDESKIAELVAHDIENDLPEAFASIKGLVFTPTFVLIENGHEIGRITGYPGESFFWEILAQMLAKTDAYQTSRMRSSCQKGQSAPC